MASVLTLLKRNAETAILNGKSIFPLPNHKILCRYDESSVRYLQSSPSLLKARKSPDAQGLPAIRSKIRCCDATVALGPLVPQI